MWARLGLGRGMSGKVMEEECEVGDYCVDR